MKSILQNNKYCFYRGATINLHKHHIYGGHANRSISERNGFWVWLEMKYHNGSLEGVHCGNKRLDLELKQKCQGKFEETHSREEFIKLIGKNYLD